ncbi:response regulator [Candidatus Saccharibacteria bacterium]|nr:response regulator [Candidatus Saccharibacteria bacterium]
MTAKTLPKIMIVEDDDIIREVYTLKFELEGFPVTAAENGQIALERAASFEPDIILLDMMMPVMGGLDFMRAWRALPERAAEVIVFSNISAPNQMNEVLALGASEYWVKSDYTPDRATTAIVERWQRRDNQK